MSIKIKGTFGVTVDSKFAETFCDKERAIQVVKELMEEKFILEISIIKLFAGREYPIVKYKR